MVSRGMMVVVLALLVACPPTNALAIDCTRVDYGWAVADAAAWAFAQSPEPALEVDGYDIDGEEDGDERDAAAGAAASAATSAASASAQAHSSANCNVGWGGVTSTPFVSAGTDLTSNALAYTTAEARAEGISQMASLGTYFRPASGTYVSGTIQVSADWVVNPNPGDNGLAEFRGNGCVTCNNSCLYFDAYVLLGTTITGVVGGVPVAYSSPTGVYVSIPFVEERVEGDIPLGAWVEPDPIMEPAWAHALATGDEYGGLGSAYAFFGFGAVAWFEMLP